MIYLLSCNFRFRHQYYLFARNTNVSRLVNVLQTNFKVMVHRDAVVTTLNVKVAMKIRMLMQRSVHTVGKPMKTAKYGSPAAVSSVNAKRGLLSVVKCHAQIRHVS